MLQYTPKSSKMSPFTGFPPKTLYAFLFPLMLAAYPVPLILLEYTSHQNLVRSTNNEGPHYVILLASCYFVFR